MSRIWAGGGRIRAPMGLGGLAGCSPRGLSLKLALLVVACFSPWQTPHIPGISCLLVSLDNVTVTVSTAILSGAIQGGSEPATRLLAFQVLLGIAAGASVTVSLQPAHLPKPWVASTKIWGYAGCP